MDEFQIGLAKIRKKSEFEPNLNLIEFRPNILIRPNSIPQIWLSNLVECIISETRIRIPDSKNRNSNEFEWICPSLLRIETLYGLHSTKFTFKWIIQVKTVINTLSTIVKLSVPESSHKHGDFMPADFWLCRLAYTASMMSWLHLTWWWRMPCMWK